MKKGTVCEGIIEKVEFPNKGLVWIDGEKVIVKNGIPGQKIRLDFIRKEVPMMYSQRRTVSWFMKI